MKKILLIAVMIIASTFVFAACTDNAQTPSAERRTLVMGTSAGFFPFEFIANSGEGVIGQYAGIDVSLAARIAEELDMEIVIQDQDFGGLLMALQNRQIDFVAAAMTIRPDRAEMVNFSVPYFDAWQLVLVAAGNDTINSVSDLEGMIVGVQLGTTAELALTDPDVNINFQNINSYDHPAPGVLALISGSIDAFVIDAPTARAFLAEYPDDLRTFEDSEFFGAEQYGMAFHLEDTELLGMFNGVLERLIEEGYVDYLYNWYNSEFSPSE